MVGNWTAPGGRYTSDRSGMARLLASNGLRYFAQQSADTAAIMIAARLPRQTGELVGSVTARTVRGRDGRWIGEAEADAPHAAAVEFGNRASKARHVLRDVARELSS
ncbi:hypothetical protein JVX90_13735 [Gordonia sp. PDNC005]|uniref:hypothetical protein n=1 Tax=Gordonia sp. PDNC005 TaxID=2811424 RepID=UPI001963A65A|nr:hypothetical protein [Gordonia sp. PDNC005]QRY61473.1 hypothetical protein JVX90_13735 [Gordonia sp. PDNC005]